MPKKATKKKPKRKKKIYCSVCRRYSETGDCCVIFSTADNPMG